MTALLSALYFLCAALTLLGILQALARFSPRPRALSPAALALCADCDGVQTVTAHGTCGTCGSAAVLKPWSLGARLRRGDPPPLDLSGVRGSRFYAERPRGAGRRGRPALELPGGCPPSPDRSAPLGRSAMVDGASAVPDGSSVRRAGGSAKTPMRPMAAAAYNSSGASAVSGTALLKAVPSTFADHPRRRR